MKSLPLHFWFPVLDDLEFRVFCGVSVCRIKFCDFTVTFSPWHFAVAIMARIRHIISLYRLTAILTSIPIPRSSALSNSWPRKSARAQSSRHAAPTHIGTFLGNIQNCPLTAIGQFAIIIPHRNVGELSPAEMICREFLQFREPKIHRKTTWI